MRLYVIGPVSGREGGNRDAFEGARRRLEAAGHTAVIPHDLVPPDAGWQAAMSKSIREMLRLTPRKKLYYGGVAELPGTIGSKGARCERGICEQLGIPHKPVDEWCGTEPME